MVGSHRLVFAMIVTLFAYLGFLWVVLVRVALLLGGVLIWGLDGMPPVVGGSVGRVLFSLGIQSMLSGPRHLLSVLALGMSVLDHVEDPPVLSFLCLLFVCLWFRFLLFPWACLCPSGSAGMGHRWWTGVEEDVCSFVFLLLQLASGS